VQASAIVRRFIPLILEYGQPVSRRPNRPDAGHNLIASAQLGLCPKSAERNRVRSGRETKHKEHKAHKESRRGLGISPQRHQGEQSSNQTQAYKHKGRMGTGLLSRPAADSPDITTILHLCRIAGEGASCPKSAICNLVSDIASRPLSRPLKSLCHSASETP